MVKIGPIRPPRYREILGCAKLQRREMTSAAKPHSLPADLAS